MTYKHYNVVVEKMPDGVETATERALFLDACYLADSKGILRMSQIELSQVTLWSLATIKRVFDKLEKAGVLVKIKHGRYQVIVTISKQPLGHETAGLNQELIKWIRRNFDEETTGYIFEDKNIPLTESQEDEPVIARAIETGLLTALTKEDGVHGELITTYQLNI